MGLKNPQKRTGNSPRYWMNDLFYALGAIIYRPLQPAAQICKVGKQGLFDLKSL